MNQLHKQAQDKIYLEHLIASIERKRRFSIENAYKTDLYSSDGLMNYMIWFEELLDNVKKNPPKGYVRTLLIHEDDCGRITSVVYELLGEAEEPIDATFEIIYSN